MDEFQSMVEETKPLYKGNKNKRQCPDFIFGEAAIFNFRRIDKWSESETSIYSIHITQRDCGQLGLFQIIGDQIIELLESYRSYNNVEAASGLPG